MIDPQNPQGPTYGQNHKKLFDGLSEQGLYTNSYEEFTVKYSSPEQQKKLFEGLKDIGMYTKSSDDFYTQYFNVKKKEKAELPPQPQEPSPSVPVLATDSTEFTPSTGPETLEPSGDSDSTVTEEQSFLGLGPDYTAVEVDEETPYFDGKMGDIVSGLGFVGDVIDDAGRAFGQGRATGDLVPFAYSVAMGDVSVTEDNIRELVSQINEYDNKMRDLGVSDEMASFQATSEANGGGAWGFFTATYENPSALPEVIVSSMSGLLNTKSAESALAIVAASTAAGATAGLVGGPAAPVTSGAGALAGFEMSLAPAFGVASGTVETAMSFVDFLREELGDQEPTYENVAPILMDEAKMRELRRRSVTRGATITAVDTFGGAMLGKMAKTMKAAGKSKVAVTGTVAGGEAGTGFGGELTAQALSGQDIDVGEALMEAGPGMLQTPVTLAGAGLQDVRARVSSKDEIGSGQYKVNGGAVTKKQLGELLEDLTDEEMGNVKIEVSNDPELEAQLEQRGRKYQISKDIPSNIQGEERQRLIDLELEKQGLEGRTTQTAGKRRSDIETEINTILETERPPVQEEAEVTAEPVVTDAQPEPAPEPLEPAQAGPIGTPEQAAKNLEAEGVFVRDKGFIADNLEGLRRRFLSARGFMPRSMFKAREKRESRVAMHANVATQQINRFNKQYEAYEKAGGNADILMGDFDSALRGDKEALGRLPDDFQVSATEMRNHIDMLTLDLINQGIIDEAVKENYVANLGSYLTRSYEVFTNKNYKDKVTQETIQSAKNYLSERYRAQAEANALDPKKNPEGLTAEELLQKEVDARISNYLDPKEAEAFISGSKDAKDLSVLKQRKDIPDEIRALMGEFSDPAQNYAASVYQVSSLAESHRALAKIKKAGEGVYLFENPQGEFRVPIAAKGSDAMNPLNGMYTTKEIAAEFNKVEEVSEKFFRRYMKVISSVKWAKTIGSVATHSKNVIGNLGFMWANGHTDMSAIGTAFSTIKADLSSGGDQALQNRFNKYVELGIIKQSAALGEINDMFKDADFQTAMEKRLNDKKSSLKGTLLKTKKGLEDAYQTEDDFFKIVAFENERNRYAKAQFGVEASELTPQQTVELDEYVAEVVKNTYPTYSRVPEAVKMIRRNPFIGNFISFTAESYRVAWNTLAQGYSEVRSENPEIRKIGAKRLAGATSYVGGKTALVGTFGKAAGVGLMGAAGELMSDEKENQREKDMRMFMAPWSRKSKVIPYDVGNGKFSYIDISASDPYGQFDKIASSFAKGENTIDAFAKGLFETVEPFIGVDIATRRFTNVMYNQNDYGKPIYNPEDPMADQTADVMKYMYDVIEPGSVTSVRKIYKSGGSAEEFAGQLTGFKPYNVDIKEQLGYTMNSYRDRLKNAQKIKYTDGVEQAGESYEDVVMEMNEYAQAASRLGVPTTDILIAIQRNAGVSKKEAAAIFSGVVKPIRPPRPR